MGYGNEVGGRGGARTGDVGGMLLRNNVLRGRTALGWERLRRLDESQGVWYGLTGKDPRYAYCAGST